MTSPTESPWFDAWIKAQRDLSLARPFMFMVDACIAPLLATMGPTDEVNFTISNPGGILKLTRTDCEQIHDLAQRLAK